jgi:hypothetical protein
VCTQGGDVVCDGSNWVTKKEGMWFVCNESVCDSVYSGWNMKAGCAVAEGAPRPLVATTHTSRFPTVPTLASSFIPPPPSHRLLPLPALPSLSSGSCGWNSGRTEDRANLYKTHVYCFQRNCLGSAPVDTCPLSSRE